MLRRSSLFLSVIVLIAVFSLLAPASADASPKITVTARGTIIEGRDVDGSLTGGVDRDLEGVSASVVQVFTLAPDTFVIDTSARGTLFAFFQEVTTTVIVGLDGLTVSSTTGSAFYVLLSGEGWGAQSTIATGTMELNASVFVFDAAFAFSSIFQDFAFTADPGDPSSPSSFGASFLDPNSEATAFYFLAQPLSVAVTVEGVAVPTPGALGVFLAGLVGLAAARRLA